MSRRALEVCGRVRDLIPGRVLTNFIAGLLAGPHNSRAFFS
jgi:hypothetical protein